MEKAKVEEIIIATISKKFLIEAVPTDNLYDIGLDSLDIVDLIMTIERENHCSIPDEKAEEVVTVQDMINVAADVLID